MSLKALLLWIFLAAGSGALARFGLTYLADHLTGGRFPLGTFAVNVIGCFLFGLIWLAASRHLLTDSLRVILMVGFLGSFTTFSSFIFDSGNLEQEGRLALASLNLVGQVALGFLAFNGGVRLGRIILGS